MVTIEEQFERDYQLGIVNIDEDKKQIIVTNIINTQKRLLELINGDKGWTIIIDPNYHYKLLGQAMKDASGEILEKYNHSFFGKILNWFGL